MDTNMSFVLSLTLAEFKAIKRAIRVLCRAGLTRDEAIGTILDSYRNRGYRRTA